MLQRLADRFLATPAGRRKVMIITTVAALVWLGALFAFRPIASTGPSANTFYTTGPAASTGPPNGSRAPFLGAPGTPTLTTLDGSPYPIDELRGRPVWIVFWASWCPPCVREAPAVQATYDAYRADGLVVLAVDAGESAAEVRAFLAAQGLTYPVALDPDASFADAFGLFGLPTHYFVSRNGIIVDRYFGELTRSAMEERARRLVGPGPSSGS